MPVYEYQCDDCATESSQWFSSVAQALATTPQCNTCGSAHLTRLISHFAVSRSHVAAGQPSSTTTPTSQTDSQALASAMRSAANGQTMSADFKEVAKRLDHGEHATSIEASLRQRVGESMQGH